MGASPSCRRRHRLRATAPPWLPRRRPSLNSVYPPLLRGSGRLDPSTMFTGDATPGRNVTLRGSSKLQNKREILERAQREREQRNAQRQRLQAALHLQSCWRRRSARRRLAATVRKEWDEDFEQARRYAGTPSIVPLLTRLCRGFASFHGAIPKNGQDPERRRLLCELILANTHEHDAASNWCLAMLSRARIDDSAVDSATTWRVQLTRLFATTLRDLSETPGPDLGAFSAELGLMVLATDVHAWPFFAALPAGRVAEATRAALLLAEAIASGELHAIAWASLRRDASRGADSTEGLVVVLALRGLRAPQRLGLAPEAAPCLRQAGHLCSSIAAVPGALQDLPPERREELRTDVAYLSHVLQALSLRMAGADVLPEVSASRKLALAGAVVQLGSWALEAGGGQGVVVAYVRALRAALGDWLAAQMQAIAGGPGRGADDSSDEDEDAEAAHGGGDDDDLSLAGDVGSRHANAELAMLLDEGHARQLFSAALTADASSCLTPLAEVYCCLLARGPAALALPRRVHHAGAARNPSIVRTLHALAFKVRAAAGVWRHLSVSGSGGPQGWAQGWADVEGPLTLFCMLANHALVVLSDDDLVRANAETAVLMPARDLARAAVELKELAVHLYTSADPGHQHKSWLRSVLLTELTRLLRGLMERDGRTHFVTEQDGDAWLVGGSASGKGAALVALVQHAPPPASDDQAALDDRKTSIAAEMQRAVAVLEHIPFALPFEGRLKALRAWIAHDQGRDSRSHFRQPVRIHRSRIVRDSFEALGTEGAALKDTLRVTLVNDQVPPAAHPLPRSLPCSPYTPHATLAAATATQGLEEAGVGEGVMKEYLVEVLKAACAPETALLTSTSAGELYPNPAAAMVVPDALALFEFLGALVAKAVFERILLDIPFALFFLQRLLGRENTINDMSSLDAELHKNLLFVKSYEGDIRDLALYFCVTSFPGP